MRSIQIEFKNKEGIMLAGRLEIPVDGKPTAYALFAHCFTCTKDLPSVRHMCMALSLHGVAVLSVDFTGLGQSSGEFEDTGFDSNIEDLVSAAEFLEKKYNAPSLLIGHSLGGAAVIYAANLISSVKAVAVIGAPSDPAHVKDLIKDHLSKIEKDGSAEVQLGGKDVTVGKELLDTVESADMKKELAKLNVPILIMHSPQDEIVGIGNAAMIYNEARHPKSFISLDGADHLLTNKGDSIFAANMIAAWSMRYLTFKQAVITTGSRVAVRIEKGSFTTEIKAGDHYLVSDEPVKDGGNDLGPTPYDLLAASLGACTAMTLKMYAERKKWDLKEAKIHLDHGKIYSKDCEECDQTEVKIDHIHREIELEGDLDSEQKQRLLEIADKCPVHKTLTQKVHITTSLYKTE